MYTYDVHKYFANLTNQLIFNHLQYKSKIVIDTNFKFSIKFYENSLGDLSR